MSDDFNVDSYPKPAHGITYCCYCINLSSATLIRFICPSIDEWDKSEEYGRFNHMVVPGYQSVIQMDEVLRYLQSRDSQAYMIFNQQRIVSVRACMIVDGNAVCTLHAGVLLQRQMQENRYMHRRY